MLAQVQSTANGTVTDGSKSQKKIDKLDDQTAELVMEYRASVRQLEELREYNAQLEKLIKAQREEMVKIRQEIEDVTTIDRTIIPHMFKMIDGLEAFVNLDTPFLINERKARVARLRSLMDRSDANPAEKYRKTLQKSLIRAASGASGIGPGPFRNAPERRKRKKTISGGQKSTSLFCRGRF